MLKANHKDWNPLSSSVMKPSEMLLISSSQKVLKLRGGKGNISVLSTTIPITTTTPPQSVPPVVPYIYPVSLLILGVVLFLALVLLVVLFYQNRVLRRVLSKRRHKTVTDAVYEEIDHRSITKRNDLIHKGHVLSEEQHSGFETVDEQLLSDISVLSTAVPIITTTTSITTVGQTVKGTNTPPQTLPAAVTSIYPVSLLVLGVVLFLALVLLVVLFYQNRVLRR
ncbi:hypothetical protein AOLI_G00312190 [Acnodon oligacanthus]